MSDGYHMSPEEFRRQGHAVVDWLANYMETVESMPVLSTVEPGDIRAQLPPSPPQSGEAFEDILRDMSEVILPGLTHWQSPNFFAFFPANTSGPSILGELMSAGLGVQGMLWLTSPACTEVETHVLDWVAQILDLPERLRPSGSGGAVIQDTASSAALCAVLAARERATDFAARRRGTPGDLVGYASAHAHSSIAKAMNIAGVGSERLRTIASTEDHRMDPDDLERQMSADIEAGLRPFFVNVTAGTTSSLAVDPIARIGEICQRHEVWLHMDAAMAGTAAVCPELRDIHDGIDTVDSYCFNPHKWMFVNFDCNCFYVADPAALVGALSILPEYLRNPATDSGGVIDYRDWQIPLGRRFRALKLWFVIRHYGVEGLRFHIRRHVELATHFADLVEAHPDFSLVVPRKLNLVCFRHVGGDSVSEAIMHALNASGDLYLTHTKLHDVFTLRLCVGQSQTRRCHLDRAWARITETARQVAGR